MGVRLVVLKLRNSVPDSCNLQKCGTSILTQLTFLLSLSFLFFILSFFKDNDCGDGSDETSPAFQCQQTTTRTTTTTATPCDGELNTYKSGIKTCNSDGCSIAYTFAALPAPATVVSAHPPVRQAGDLDSSSEYAVLKAGGSTMADCKQSTTNWQSPAACQRVDVKSKISSQVANNGPSSNGYTYRSKGAYYCSGSRSEFSGTFSTLASCQAACSAKLECHTLNFYPNSDACYWCPSSGWSSEVTGSANGQMWEKGDAVPTSTAATTTVAGADTPTYSLAVELDSTSSVNADDDDSNGPTNTMLGADFTLVVCEDPGCAKGTKKGSGQACVSCAANEYQLLDKYEGLTCTPQPYCGRGQKTSADTKLAKRTCASCISGQYQDSSSHRDVACKAQPSCARGEKISSASVRTKQTCSQCPDGYYQDTSSHSEVTCKAQPYCGKDQKISTPSSAVLLVVPCGANTTHNITQSERLAAYPSAAQTVI